MLAWTLCTTNVYFFGAYELSMVLYFRTFFEKKRNPYTTEWKLKTAGKF